MNDEALLLFHECDQLSKGIQTSEMEEFFKMEKAKKAASKLVGELFRKAGHDRKAILWGYHKRVAEIEDQAKYVTNLLGDQALALKDASLCAHWTRVRISIRDKTYK